MTERPRDHLDEVFDRYATVQQCVHCGVVAPCRPPALKDRVSVARRM